MVEDVEELIINLSLGQILAGCGTYSFRTVNWFLILEWILCFFRAANILLASFYILYAYESRSHYLSTAIATRWRIDAVQQSTSLDVHMSHNSGPKIHPSLIWKHRLTATSVSKRCVRWKSIRPAGSFSPFLMKRYFHQLRSLDVKNDFRKSIGSARSWPFKNERESFYLYF